jgi:transcriptional regulator with XRE-family HTH domain
MYAVSESAEFGKILRKIRESLGVRQREFARLLDVKESAVSELRALIARQGDLATRTGISRSTMNALENNRLFLSSPYALRIAEILGCRLDDLYEKRNARGTLTEREGNRGN